MISCTICGSEDWVRVSPGQIADATSLSPDQRQAVLLFPTDAPEIPAAAWCAGCDPLIVRGVLGQVDGADREYLSWGAAL